MKRLASNARRIAAALVALSLCHGLMPTTARALPTSEERLKILTDPEDIRKKLEKDKDKTRPPLELFRSQVAPFDILPFVKAKHWSTLSLEMRSNYEDYSGAVNTAPINLLDYLDRPLPQEIVFSREARLPKTQRMHLSLQMMLPRIPKSLDLQLARADAIRPDEMWPAMLRTLEPHQMLIVALTKEANETYSNWNRFASLYPSSLDRADNVAADRRRYYRMVLPLEPEKLPLSAHPLTWTTISHVIWDELPPDNLNPSQQQAMLDWLHWGGQLVLIGGAGTTYSTLKDSFLSPYLPADVAGENALLNRDDLTPLSITYPPLVAPSPEELDNIGLRPDSYRQVRQGYRAPVPIVPAAESAGLPGRSRAETRSDGNRAGRIKRSPGRRRVARRPRAGLDARTRSQRPLARQVARNRHLHPTRDPASSRGIGRPSADREPDGAPDPAFGSRAELGALPVARHGNTQVSVDGERPASSSADQ